jgi:glycosyltransferase involved in cell wall biosynthesis
MRVAFLINELRNRGGQRTFVDDANELARLGDDVMILTLYPESDNSIADELDPAVQRVDLRASGPLDVDAVRRCARLLHSSDTRVLMTTLNDANIFGRWVVLASARRVALLRREAMSPRRKAVWQQMLDLPFDALTHRIVVLSEDARRDAIRRAPWRRRKIATIRNGVAMPKDAAPDRTQNRQTPHLLSVGRLVFQKDHATLITALVMLAGRGASFTAEIIGDGPLGADLRAQVARSSLSDRITFRGPLPHRQLLDAYSNADVFVLPSRFEGCPHVVLEAMAAGLPIVASRVGGVTELVEQGISGRLVPAGNPAALSVALWDLVTQPEIRASLGGGARQQAARFQPEQRLGLLRQHLLGADAISRRRTS